jgi:hypothetical protein
LAVSRTGKSRHFNRMPRTLPVAIELHGRKRGYSVDHSSR